MSYDWIARLEVNMIFIRYRYYKKRSNNMVPYIIMDRENFYSSLFGSHSLHFICETRTSIYINTFNPMG